MNIPIRELATQIHETARQKGWWPDGGRNPEELTMLIISELAEGMEEARHPKFKAQLIYCSALGEERRPWPSQDNDPRKPEGLPIELADATIRILDTAMGLGYKIPDTTLDTLITHSKSNTCVSCWPFSYSRSIDNVGAMLLAVSRAALYSHQHSHDTWGVLHSIATMCLRLDINLEDAIRIKMQYNRTRPVRHGGKLA